jgi:hypothetical protein
VRRGPVTQTALLPRRKLYEALVDIFMEIKRSSLEVLLRETSRM